MYMSKGDIVKEYKEAKDKQKQITILAQTNVCTVADIRKILSDAGIEDIPKRHYNRSKTVKQTETVTINGQKQRAIVTVPVEKFAKTITADPDTTKDVEPLTEKSKAAKGIPEIVRETIKDKIAEIARLNDSAEGNIKELQAFIKSNEDKIKELSEYIK